MLFGRRLTLDWSISSWALFVICCVLHVSDARLGMEPVSPGEDTIRSHVQRVGPPWLANIINERLPDIPGRHPSWFRKREVNYHKNNKDDKEGVIIFKSIRGVIENNATMVKLDVIGDSTFMVTNLTLIYNGFEEQMQLSPGWTGERQVFNFEAEIFQSENIELSLIGRNGGIDSPVTTIGNATFEFKGPDVQMAFVGSDTKTSVRIAGKVADSGVSGSVKCKPHDNETACYDLEKDVSYCKIVTTDEGSNVTVCDSSRYIDPLNELHGDLDLEWMDHEMEMDGMMMEMPMLMVMAMFTEMPAKIEVLVYADDDPSKMYSPMDYNCDIQHDHEHKMDMNMTMVMCHQMLPENIPSKQEGVQVLAVALDENGNVIQSGVQHSIVHEDYTAIIVGSCLAAVVGMACIVALVGCYVEKKKKKKLQDKLHSTSVPKL